MSAINAWGIPIIAFAVVLGALLCPLRKLPQEERRPYGILLGMISAVYVALCVTVAVAPNENLWNIVSNALLSLVTLYLIHLARVGERKEEMKKLGVGLVLSAVMLCIFWCVTTGKTQEPAVTVSFDLLMAHAAGLLELCLFEKRTAGHSDKTQS